MSRGISENMSAYVRLQKFFAKRICRLQGLVDMARLAPIPCQRAHRGANPPSLGPQGSGQGTKHPPLPLLARIAFLSVWVFSWTKRIA